MTEQPSDTHIFVPNKSTAKKHPLYFLLLISPVTWFKCFALIFGRTRARTHSLALLQYFVFLLTILLMTTSCYLSYVLADDAGQYNLYLSNVALNMTSMSEGRSLFNELIWRTVLKTFFLGIIFGLIQACNLFLAAQWRQRLCDRFQELLLRSVNGCVLYEMAQTNENIYKVITNDIKQFTSDFSSVLFGCLFFKSIISMFALIITACVLIVRVTNGDASGILICFVAFIFCILITLPSAQLYNWNLVTQSKVKGRFRSYMQRIQTHAQCIVLYGSQRVELKYVQRLLSSVYKSMLLGSIGFTLINFPIQLSYVLTGLCTYTIPSVIFFFIQKTQQTPELAQNLLTAIPFYSLLITLLTQLISIVEFALATVTMGDHLWTMLNHLENLTKQHEQRLAYEQESGVRQENANMFILQHLNISVPGMSVDAPSLQRDVNLEAIRGQCILISGPSGCGKTSLFRICAGLQSIDAKQIMLPARHHLLFIPQRPYLPVGSLRFQALFLLEDQSTISDRDLFQLFRSVNLLYLLERYTLIQVVAWSMVLSIGEQQRLSFVRLLALFTLSSNKKQLVKETLVFLDESTSAIDIKTEHELYLRLIQLGVWFVTISHRSSLVHLHTKWLQFLSDSNCQQAIEPAYTGNQNLFTVPNNDLNEDYTHHIDTKQLEVRLFHYSPSVWRLIIDIFKFLHLPFHPNDKKLKIETIIAWLLTLAIVGVATWTFYDFINRTATLYNGLSGYASGSLSVEEAKQSIKSDIISYILIVLATPVTYTLSTTGGRLLASLYTRRQLDYLVRLLLDNDLLYHSRHMSELPNILSHEIAELNIEVFNLLFGQVYYVGIITQFALNIVLSVVLSKQNGGSLGNLIVYLFAFGFFFITNLVSIVVKKWAVRDETHFVQFVNAHKRIDLHAEQIALSGEDVHIAEENQLRQKLDASIQAQICNGYFYSIIVGVARLSVENIYLVSYGIPAAIFFHTYYTQGVRDPTIAQTFLTLSVYIINLYASASFITFFSNPLTRIQSIGIHVVNNLKQLQRINMDYRRLVIEEQERRRRVFIEPKSNEPSLVLEQVDVRIPHSAHVLLSNVNLALHSSDNLIITGPSGSGKSSLLRLLAGLNFIETDQKNAMLRIIPRQNIIILCQQLYLIRGTLREQLSYLRLAHGLDSVMDDSYVQQLLNELNLGHLLDRYSMDGQRHVWSELLSIGEQQRLMMASAFLVGSQTVRLFILDEITSGCDKRTEQAIYKRLQRSNIQFISISHRNELIKYHSRQMTIDAQHTLIPVPLLQTRF